MAPTAPQPALDKTCLCFASVVLICFWGQYFLYNYYSADHLAGVFFFFFFFFLCEQEEGGGVCMCCSLKVPKSLRHIHPPGSCVTSLTAAFMPLLLFQLWFVFQRKCRNRTKRKLLRRTWKVGRSADLQTWRFAHEEKNFSLYRSLLKWMKKLLKSCILTCIWRLIQIKSQVLAAWKKLEYFMKVSQVKKTDGVQIDEFLLAMSQLRHNCGRSK